MDLSYEETLQRIEEIEKNDVLHRKVCREKRFPYRISLYKGQGQIIIVPSITGIGWNYVEMAWHRKVEEVLNNRILGETLLEALEQIRISPVDARTVKEREQDSIMVTATSSKTYTEFNKMYLRCGVTCYEDGTWVISQTRRLAGNKGYGGDDSTLIYLQANATAEELGNALLNSFKGMELFYGINPKKDVELRRDFETFSDIRLSFIAPPDDVYTDEQDFHAAEIYQGYSFYKDGKEESVADMYFASASELDCDITPEHIKRVYESYDGSVLSFSCDDAEHSVFERRIEMETASTHRIVYIKTISECELLSCELVLKKKMAGKRLHDKIVKDFEAMVSSCRKETNFKKRELR